MGEIFPIQPYCEIFTGRNCSYPCSEMNCDSEILEQTDCQVWTCYKHNPSGKNGNYIIIVAIAFGILALLFLVALTIIGIRIVCRSERQPQSQESPEISVESGAKEIFAIPGAGSLDLGVVEYVV